MPAHPEPPADAAHWFAAREAPAGRNVRLACAEQTERVTRTPATIEERTGGAGR